MGGGLTEKVAFEQTLAGSDRALKRKEILTHATTWMNSEDIMLSEISQSQKECMILLI